MRGLVAGLVVVMLATPAAAHPGRLDAEGCHRVHTRFVHQSGQIDEVGTRHCHRALGSMRLDGTEQLQDEPRTADGVPQRLDPERAFTAREFNALAISLDCLDRVGERLPGDPLDQRDGQALMACAAGKALTPDSRQSLDRLRWIFGERW